MNLIDDFNEKSGSADKDIEYYEEQGHVRSVCFVQPGGERLALNYAFLVAPHYKPPDIILTFTTHEITLRGHNLMALFDGFDTQTIRRVTAVDARYLPVKEKEGDTDNDAPCVTVIEIRKV